MGKLQPDDMKPYVEADFREWMLRFRQESGRPLTAIEHAMAKVAHATGFTAGFTAGAQVILDEVQNDIDASAASHGAAGKE